MIKLDIGCGKRGSKYPGYIGLDLWSLDGVKPHRRPAYIQCDLIKDSLPFEQESVDHAICLHVLEHLTRPETVQVLHKIRNVLKPKAVCIVSTPDLHMMAQKYLEQDILFYDKRYPGTDRRLWNGSKIADKFLDSILGMGKRGHKYAYDLDSLLCLGVQTGFLVDLVPDDCEFRTRKDHEIVLEFLKESKT